MSSNFNAWEIILCNEYAVVESIPLYESLLFVLFKIISEAM